MLGCRHIKRSLSFICCLKKGENGRNDVNYFEILVGLVLQIVVIFHRNKQKSFKLECSQYFIFSLGKFHSVHSTKIYLVYFMLRVCALPILRPPPPQPTQLKKIPTEKGSLENLSYQHLFQCDWITCYLVKTTFTEFILLNNWKFCLIIIW